MNFHFLVIGSCERYNLMFVRAPPLIGLDMLFGPAWMQNWYRVARTTSQHVRPNEGETRPNRHWFLATKERKTELTRYPVIQPLQFQCLYL